jgi:hypothetical protein
MILWQRPDVVDHAFKPAYDALLWDDAPELFAAWQAGRTGYPLVDAAQRQLLQSGWMHNRLRMVSASFLTKDLGIDWRWGRHFALAATSTSPPTTAAGNGRPPAAATRSRISAFSIRSHSRKNSIRGASSSAAMCRNSPPCRTSSSTRPGAWQRPRRTIRRPSSIMPRRGKERWPFRMLR